MPRKLVELEVEEISLVDKAANKKKFLFLKRDKSKEEESKPITVEAMAEQVAKIILNKVNFQENTGMKKIGKKTKVKKDESLGNRIKSLLEQKGMSVEEFATAVGIEAATAESIIIGQTEPTEEVAQKNFLDIINTHGGIGFFAQSTLDFKNAIHSFYARFI